MFFRRGNQELLRFFSLNLKQEGNAKKFPAAMIHERKPAGVREQGSSRG